MRVVIVTPGLRAAHSGNRTTATRWADLLSALGHDVVVREEWQDQPCDLLVALHAVHSAPSVRRFRERHPRAPLVVALPGPDLYGALPDDGAGMNALQAADRLIVLQPLGLEALPASVRPKARVIVQSAGPGPDELCDETAFQVCVLAHLRPVKDPLRAAYAVRQLPQWSRIQVVHAGAALSRDLAEEARDEQGRNPRYRWLGDLPRTLARSMLARSRVLALTSRSEGGANALVEAIAAGKPVIATSIPGSVGLLGEAYPGYVPVADTTALTDALLRAESDSGFLAALEDAIRELRPLVDPDRERAAWAALLAELSA